MSDVRQRIREELKGGSTIDEAIEAVGLTPDEEREIRRWYNQSQLAAGRRVTVSIADPDTWAHGAAECLNGKTGTVERRHGTSDEWLVNFDSPAKTWHAWQTPWTSGWFASDELKVTP